MTDLNDPRLQHDAGSESHPHNFSLAGEIVALYTRGPEACSFSPNSQIPISDVRFYVRWEGQERVVSSLPAVTNYPIDWKAAIDVAARWVNDNNAFGFLLEHTTNVRSTDALRACRGQQ